MQQFLVPQLRLHFPRKVITWLMAATLAHHHPRLPPTREQAPTHPCLILITQQMIITPKLVPHLPREARPATPMPIMFPILRPRHLPGPLTNISRLGTPCSNG
jgi:hypothetical protein